MRDLQLRTTTSGDYTSVDLTLNVDSYENTGINTCYTNVRLTVKPFSYLF